MYSRRKFHKLLEKSVFKTLSSQQAKITVTVVWNIKLITNFNKKMSQDKILIFSLNLLLNSLTGILWEIVIQNVRKMPKVSILITFKVKFPIKLELVTLKKLSKILGNLVNLLHSGCSNSARLQNNKNQEIKSFLANHNKT